MAARPNAKKVRQSISAAHIQKKGAADAGASGDESDEAVPSPRGRAPPRRDSSSPKPGGKGKEMPPPPAAAAAKGKKMSRISVCVRKRPLNRDEIGRGEKDIVTVEEENSKCTVHEPKVKVDMTKYIEEHEYVFDAVFDETATNQNVYERTAKPLINSIFQNGKATCFAYGQTGSGKTFTMMGNGTDGLYVMAAQDLYRMLKKPEYKELRVYVSFFEIYGGVLFDLLNERKKLHAREDHAHKVQIVGLDDRVVENVEDFLELINYGNTVRSSGATGVNADSSRSHAILQIVLRNRSDKEVGRLSFVDLAGSERAADTTDMDRQRRMEGADINKSLLALKECIRALEHEKSHTPFRQSKLTQVLKDSFVGNSRTVMIANISPNGDAAENTLNTLRYADRVKELRSQTGAPAPVALPAAKKGISAYPDNRGGGPAPAMPPPAIPKRKPDRKSGGRGEEPASPHEVEELMEIHSELVTTILQEKEDIILSHRQQIDEMMEVVKQEMKLLHTVDQPGSAVEDYVKELGSLLNQKMIVIQRLHKRLAAMQERLKQEEELSRSLERSLPRSGL